MCKKVLLFEFLSGILSAVHVVTQMT